MKHLKWMILICLFAAGCASGSDPTPIPSVTNTLVPSPLPSATPTTEVIPAEATEFVDAEATEEPPLEIIIEASEDEEIPAPISINLPEGWTEQHGTVLLEDVQGFDILPFTAYVGPVSGGNGFIIVVWGFGSLVYGNPFAQDFRDIDLSSDGLRLLYLAVMDVQCVVAHDEASGQTFTIGGLPAMGNTFEAYDCPENADTQGWYAALSQERINYVFYAYTEPFDALDGPASDELQAILDTVQFEFQERYGDAINTAATPEGTP